MEIDEALIGAPFRGRKDRTAADNAVVVGAVEVLPKKKRGTQPGRVRLGHVATSSKPRLTVFIKDSVEPGALVITDGHETSDEVEKLGYEHAIECATTGEKRENVLKHLHMVFTSLKTWLEGTHHGGVSKKHLQQQLEEFTFRFNRRRTPPAVFQTTLGIAAKTPPRTYERIYAGEPEEPLPLWHKLGGGGGHRQQPDVHARGGSSRRRPRWKPRAQRAMRLRARSGARRAPRSAGRSDARAFDASQRQTGSAMTSVRPSTGARPPTREGCGAQALWMRQRRPRRAGSNPVATGKETRNMCVKPVVRSALALGAAAIAFAVMGCSSVPQEVTFSKNGPDWEIKAKWDGYVITIEGIEDGKEEVIDLLADAYSDNNQAAIDGWTAVLNKILQIKADVVNKSTQAVYDHQGVMTLDPVPDFAAITRPDLGVAMAAYMEHFDGLAEACNFAVANGIPEAHLLQVKAALLAD